MADVAYWSRGVAQVPYVTGAARVMDCADLIDAFDKLGVTLPLPVSVLDIGCGTGRLAQLMPKDGTYVGADVTPDAVQYNADGGRVCLLIAEPEDLYRPAHYGIFQLACALSVFTHIGREERQRYLQVLQTLSSWLVVDIIPGEEGGDVALWRANVEDFEADAAREAWDVRATCARVSPDGVLHRYYLMEGL